MDQDKNEEERKCRINGKVRGDEKRGSSTVDARMIMERNRKLFECVNEGMEERVGQLRQIYLPFRIHI